MSRKSKYRSQRWTPLRICDCCGKFVILLLIPEMHRQPNRSKWKTCFLKSWDGNPFYNSSVHHTHPPKRYARYMDKVREARKPDDPFFSLD